MLILIFIIILFIIIYYFNLNNLIDINKYSNDPIIYNIIKKYYNVSVIEPSIKIKTGNIILYNRYSIPIFNIKQNFDIIKKIINDILIHFNLHKMYYTKVYSFIKTGNLKNTDLIIGIDSNENTIKFYLDFNKYIKCFIINYNNKTNKIKEYKTININNNIIQNINKKISNIINHNNILDSNNIISIYKVNNVDEFHVILKNKLNILNINNIYVISVKNTNEITFYIR